MPTVSFKRWFALFVVVLLLAGAWGSLHATPALAQTASHHVVPARPHASSAHVTIIVLDMSGSMAQNDPNGIRCSAANAYIDLSGANDYIGAIGLDNNNGLSGGAHNFQFAQKWADPAVMTTVNDRQTLKQTIASKSNNCNPDASTPTYDALQQTLTMLASATKDGKSGSAILLTDGTPSPDTDPQMSAINSELVPQFKSHNWPVDTIALGQDSGNFHAFLQGIANASSGNFYDDTQGEIPGVSPLNIGSFFVTIYGLRHPDVVLREEIHPTTAGGTPQANFSVTDYVNDLNIIIVKEHADLTASLVTPSGQHLTIGNGGVFVATDPHYIIFTIQQPQSGQWELDASGSGQYLMYSAKTSNIGMAILKPDLQTPTQPLGSPITVSVNLTANGHLIIDNSFQVNGTITYSGGAGGAFTQGFVFDDNNSPGTFVGKVSVPYTAPAGTYTILVQASGASRQDVVASATRTVRVELFPEPLFYKNQDLSASSNLQPTTDPVSSTVIKWDPVMQTIYSIPWGIMQWLGDRALQHHPAKASAVVQGQVFVGTQPYANAMVTGTAVQEGTAHATAITVVNDGDGRFHVIFPALASGTYDVTFTAMGSFKDSHGDLSTVTRVVKLTVQSAPLNLELFAIAVTLLYLFILLLMYLTAKNRLTPAPSGTWSRNGEDGERLGGDTFAPSRLRNIGFIQRFLHRNVIYSHQARMNRGLQLTFNRGGLIRIRPTPNRDGARWRDNTDNLFREIRTGNITLTYIAGTEEEERINYTIISDRQQTARPRNNARAAARVYSGNNTSSVQDSDENPYME